MTWMWRVLTSLNSLGQAGECVLFFLTEATVRSELMEQVPHVAMYCLEKRHIFQDSVPTYLLPMVVKYLNDMNNQVMYEGRSVFLVYPTVQKTDNHERLSCYHAMIHAPVSNLICHRICTFKREASIYLEFQWSNLNTVSLKDKNHLKALFTFSLFEISCLVGI